MKLALWNTPSMALFAAGAEAVPGLSVVQTTPQDAMAMLLDGTADVALVPSLLVFSHADVFSVLPGAAFSTWKAPYARLVLPDGLERAERVVYAPEHAQEALLARIVLHEHYGLKPSFEAIEEEEAAGEAARLVVGAEAATWQSQHLTLNLAQEWYELANYPMVWGLFVARRDEAVPAFVEAVVALAEAAEAKRPLWLQAREMPPELHAFYAEDLRVRFDDLATASLTEFRQYLYYYHVTEDLPELPLYELPDDGEDERTPLL